MEADRANLLLAFHAYVAGSYLRDDAEVLMDAARFADEAHAAAGQLMPYTGEPYVAHSIAVAMVLMGFGRPLNEVLAGLLHDVPEDTGRTFAEIRERFGLVVAGYVQDVTNVSRPEDGTRTVRKAMEIEHLAGASEGGQNVKLGDVAVNARTIASRDPRFAKVYLKEQGDQVAVLRAGDPRLIVAAQTAVSAGLRALDLSAVNS
jgi:(p)ppGpp synthase/HD superfamily hydrolase